MTETAMDKARLAAFVDGELSPEDAAEVVMHLADHPADQAYVDNLLSLNVLIADAYAAPLGEPVPPAILATIAADGQARPVTRLAAWRPGRMRMPGRMALGGGMALAAGLAAVIIVSDISDRTPGTVSVGMLPVDHAQAHALNELDTGETRMLGTGVAFSVTASFATTAKGVCREFNVAEDGKSRLDIGIACPAGDQPGHWRVEVTDTLITADNPAEITPASGAAADPVGAFLDQVGAGQVLTPEEEAAARSRNWRSAE